MTSFPVQLSFRGSVYGVEATLLTTADELGELAIQSLPTADDEQLKLLYKGKRLQGTGSIFSKIPGKIPKVMVLATPAAKVDELNTRRSDPTIRGFDQERKVMAPKNVFWGPQTAQDRNYKFCRFQACTWQSFGHRPTDGTPHDYQALALLERLATDPGVVAVMRERELVVGTLGEMDPVDDRIMHQKQQEGGCLLGYNTNRGQRIDIKLRTDDLRGFRPYPELAATIIHELSHNWVGDHNLLFWTNYGQMRSEYIYTHTRHNAVGQLVEGQTTAQRAGVPACGSVNDVMHLVLSELIREMTQHGLHPQMIESAVRERCDQLERDKPQPQLASSSSSRNTVASPREMALEAAERRLKDAKNKSSSD